jgi:hypothetical protein
MLWKNPDLAPYTTATVRDYSAAGPERSETPAKKDIEGMPVFLIRHCVLRVEVV